MQVSIENTGELVREISFSAPVEHVKSRFDEKVQEISTSAKIDGFSPGRKVPKKVVERKFGKRIRAEVLENIVQAEVKDALDKHNLKPANQPAVKDLKDDDNGISFKVVLEVMPDIELKDYSEISIVKNVADIKDKDVENFVEKLRDRLGKWDTAERKAKEGDKVFIDYTSTIDGDSYENSDAFDVEVMLGDNKFFKEIEDKLYGAQNEDEFEVKVTYPQNHTDSNIAGKKALFKVKVVRVKEKVLAEINEDFAKKIGIPDSDVSKVNEKAKKMLEEQVANNVKESQKQAIFDELAKQYDFSVPDSLVAKEKQELFSQGVSESDLNQDKEKIEKDAVDRVRVGLLLTHIVDKEKIKVSEDKLRAELQQFAAMFGGMEYIAKMYQNSPELRANLNHRVLMDEVVEFLLTKVNTKEEKVSVDEILG